MSINLLIESELFNMYEQLSFEVSAIQNRKGAIDTKKVMMSELYLQYKDQLSRYNKIAADFANSFIDRYKLNDNIIKAKLISPTPYGGQPKDYLWSGISIDKDKSFSFQYSWVFKKDGIEVTFCFGSGVSTAGNIDPEKKVQRESRMRALEKHLIRILSDLNKKSLVEQLITKEGFVFTTEWLNPMGENISDIDEFLKRIQEKNGAKSGITRYFKCDELLKKDFNLEENIYRYFDIFRPIWDQLHMQNEGLLIKEDPDINDDNTNEGILMIENSGKELFKQLFINLSMEKKEIKTLVSNEYNWITKVSSKGLFVETIASREKYQKEEIENPYFFISFDFILEGWEEFLQFKKASAKDFNKAKGRSSFLMAFFNELPFIEKDVDDLNTAFIKLKEFTTDQLPEASLNQVTELITEVIEDNLDPRTISQKYNDDATKRLKLRARQGLKILGFTDDTYAVSDLTLNEYEQSNNKNQFLSNKIRKSNYLSIIYNLLTYLNGVPKNDKLRLLSEVGRLIVRNSKTEQNQMLESVAEYRTRNILNWFKETGMVDELWNRVPLVYNSTEPNADTVKDNTPIKLPIKELIEHIDKYISSKGFYYEKQEIMNLYLSLRTKPFVIISGISGTGKTMLIKWVAESIGATAENGQFALIPVRPDWDDGSDLLGYVDIAGNFKEGPLTTVIKRAVKNPEKPYFVLLDEMNLAKVEYYFSDILSVMESREKKSGTIVSLPLFKNLIFPENVYIIGTVNMDETTHPFSKKVLDRANTIDFNRINLDFLEFLRTINPVEPIYLHNHSLVSSYIHLKDVYNVYSDLVVQASQKLGEINDILKIIGAHVGYRVRDEICFYLAYNQQGELMTFDEAFDHCILQKILPRISGSDSRVERILKDLFTLFTHRDFSEEPQIDEESISMAMYPKSAQKVYEMLGRLEDGFTSFWIS